MSLKYVIYEKTELEAETEFLDMLQKSAYDILVYEKDNTEKLNLDKTIIECGLLVTKNGRDYKKACELGLAALPYDKPDPAAAHDAYSPDAGAVNEAYALDTSTMNEAYTSDFEGAWMVAEGLEEIDADFLDKVYRRYHNLPWVILYTRRCYLRELCMADMDALFALYAKKGVTAYMEPLYERKQEEAYQKAYIEHMYRYYGYGMWLVCDRDTHEIIGRAGLEHRDYGDETELEMGYLIAPEKQRMGYAKEVCQAIITYAQENTLFSRINCLIHPDNTASLRLVETLGFTRLCTTEMTGKIMKRYVFDL